MRKNRIGLIALAVALLVIAAIAIPGIIASQRAPGERNAAATLRDLARSQTSCRQDDWDRNGRADYWVRDVKGLVAVSGGALLDVVGQADHGHPGAVPKAGALYAVIPLDASGRPYDDGSGRNAEAFALCAWYVPGAGRLTLIVNEDLAIWVKDTGNAPVDRWPRDPAAEGWRKLD